MQKRNAAGEWEPFYVGKTIQGEGDPLARFTQHLREKKAWIEAYERGKIRVMDTPLAEGEGTPFETAIMEQHKFMEFGSLKKDNPESILTKKINALDEDKFNEFRDRFGNNPCARL